VPAFILVIAVAVVFLPMPAYAFGPMAHVGMGLDVLAHAGSLGAGLGVLLNRHRSEFLLGTLGPDRVLAKNLAPYAWHSHNWDRAFNCLRRSRNDAERAMLLGWVCHLAADTVSHNFYVPTKITQSYTARGASHAYWEMRFDMRFTNRIGPLRLKALGLGAPEHLMALKKILPATLLGRSLNFGLTGIALRVQGGRAYTRLGSYLDRRSRLEFLKDESDDVRRLATEAQMDVLAGNGDSRITLLDPRGIDSLRTGRRTRDRLRIMDVHRPSSLPEIASITSSALHRFRETVESSLVRAA